MPEPVILIPAIGAVLGLACLFPAVRAARLRRFLSDTPTSKAMGVFIGHVEMRGTVESEAPLVSFLAERRCVHHRWSVEEHWRRTVTEHYTDSKGVRRTRTRTESGTTTVASGGESVPFYLKDETGVVLVRPEGARIEPLTIFSKSCGRGDPLYFEKGPRGAVSNSTHVRSFTEVALPLHHEIFVAGSAREREDVVAPEIAADPQARIFVISVREERAIDRGYAWSFWLWTVFGAVLAIGAAVIALANADPEPVIEVLTLVGTTAGYVAAVVLSWALMAYNSMVGLRQRVRQAWSNIDVQLKRRHDLLPRLVAVVEGMRGHERETQELIATLRAQAQSVGASGIVGVAPTIAALVERYPELTAQRGFLELQTELADTETRIALARGFYNGIAVSFNARLLVVPDRFVASFARLRPFELFQASGLERETVDVSFVK